MASKIAKKVTDLIKDADKIAQDVKKLVGKALETVKELKDLRDNLKGKD